MNIGHRATPQTRCNVNLPSALWDRFEEVAKANFRSRSDHIRFLIAEAVRKHDDEQRGIGRQA